jgi:hypothetical protein
MVRVGVLGRIVSGDRQGSYVRVDDDQQNTGGYLVLVSADPTFKSGEGSDDWVESEQHLEAYFRASKWAVNWLSD